MGCTSLIDKLTQPITLEPLAKFPVVRDLIVDRSRMFEALKRVHAWIPIDGTYDLGPGRHAYLVAAKGRIRVNGQDADPRDGIAIRDVGTIEVEALDDAELVLVDSL